MLGLRSSQICPSKKKRIGPSTAYHKRDFLFLSSLSMDRVSVLTFFRSSFLVSKLECLPQVLEFGLALMCEDVLYSRAWAYTMWDRGCFHSTSRLGCVIVLCSFFFISAAVMLDMAVVRFRLIFDIPPALMH
jgi:hypothetical protein